MSFTMLWFMVFAAALRGRCSRTDDEGTIDLLDLLLVLLGLHRGAAPSGFIGGLDSPFNKLVFDKHQNTIQLRVRPPGRHLLHRLGADHRRLIAAARLTRR